MSTSAISDFARENWFQALLIVSLAIFGYARVDELTRRFEVVERQGSPITRERLSNLETKTSATDFRLNVVEGEGRHILESFADMKADLRLISEWVRDQKAKAK